MLAVVRLIRLSMRDCSLFIENKKSIVEILNRGDAPVKDALTLL